MNKYEVVKLIGVGGEAKAHLVKRINSDQLYVMKQRKFYLLEEANEGLFEAVTLAKIQSPYIVKFEEVFLDNDGDSFSLCIIMEYCVGGDLMNNLFERVSNTYKNNGNNGNCNTGNAKTNSTSSNNSSINECSGSNNGNKYNNFNTLKAYENFFSKYLPNEALKGIVSVEEPEKLKEEESHKLLITLNGEQDIQVINNCNLANTSDQSLHFSMSSNSSSFSALDEISSPISNGCNNVTNKINSPQLECVPPEYLEKISSDLNSPIFDSPRKVNTLQLNVDSISNGGGKSSTTLNICNSDIVVEAVSPIKTESIRNQSTVISPCTSGPTSPQMISISDDRLSNSGNNTFNNSKTTTTSTISNGSPVEKKPSKIPWWKTYKSTKPKERKALGVSSANSSGSTSASSSSNSLNGLYQNSSLSNSCGNQLTKLSMGSGSNSMTNLLSNVGSGSSSVSVLPRIEKRLYLKWLYQICMGVQSIHKSHLLHRDLKSENIFLTECQTIKIGDFGLATKNENSISGIAGTYFYLSPEILMNTSYSRPSDIFSLGCLFYEMYTLHLLPLTKRSIGQEIIENKFDKKAFKDEFDEKDEQIADLILQLLNLDPNQRPTIDLILQNKLFENQKNNGNINGASNGNNRSKSGTSEIFTRGNTSVGLNVSQINLFSKNNNNNEFDFIKRQLDKSELDRAAEILCDSFNEEPRFQFVCGATSDNVETRNKSVELGQMIRSHFFSMCVKLMFQNKFMLWGAFEKDTNKMVGVSCWSTPGQAGAPPMVQIVVKILSMLPKFGFRTMKRIGKLMANIEKANKNASDSTDVYYLPYIGISKEYRDQDIGKTLLKPVIEFAEYQSKTVKTICFNQKQINFFSKLGLSVTHTEKILNLKGINSIYVMSK